MNTGGLLFRHLNQERLVSLQNDAGWEIGSHTVHHPDLTRIPEEYVEPELTLSKSRLETLLGKPVRSLAVPFGRYNVTTLNAAVRAGYSIICGCTVSEDRRSEIRIKLIDRKSVYLFDSLSNIRAKIYRTPYSGVETLKLRIINMCSYATSLLKPPKLDQYRS